MNHTRRYLLALSVHLNTRGFAFVLFESPLFPFDWGTPEVRGTRKHERCLEKIAAIIDQYEPEGLILQDMSDEGTHRAQRIVKLNAAIIALAEVRILGTDIDHGPTRLYDSFEKFGRLRFISAR
jgi:hypothetical protein